LGALIGGGNDDGGALAAGRLAAAAITEKAQEAVPEEDRILHLDPQAIQPNPKQPRKAFNEEALEELCESIRRSGVQEPVIVRKAGDNYELVSGERRVRASIMAGQQSIPAICRKVTDREMLRLGLVENIQREDLNPIELAQAYQALIDEFDWTQEQLADEVGKKRATVTNTLRLLNLPEEVRQYVVEGSLTMGHARAMLALESPQAQLSAARKTIALGLSVRQAEKLASEKAKPKKPSNLKDANVSRIEDELRHRLSTKVALKHGKSNRGRIEIEYYSLDDLERVLSIIRGKP
jgi:ParB family chromosome partitioning protein